MFIGHYAASFAAKKVDTALPLWLLFIAVQFTDYIWALLLILGIEKARYTPGFTEASALDLYHMPYTHSLIAAIFWSVVFAGLYLIIRKMRGGDKSTGRSAVILGLAVFSHWLTDLLVHVPDLPLFFDEPKVGFGLWRHFWVSQALEVGLLALFFIWYLRHTRPSNRRGQFLPLGLAALFVLIQTYSHHAPPPPDMAAFGREAIIAYSLFALMAWWVDRNRSPIAAPKDQG